MLNSPARRVDHITLRTMKGKLTMRTVATTVLVLGAMLVGAQLYLVLLPHSPALGVAVVIGTGAALAAVLLWIDQIVQERRGAIVDPAVDTGTDSID